MKILAVKHAIPQQRITNQDVLDMIKTYNEKTMTEDQLEALQMQVQQFLEIAGTKERFFLSTNETAIDLALKVGKSALSATGIQPEQVDFLIYVGVGRGWLEPAMANVVQCELGMVNATCFDILDACMSWLRALHIAHNFIRNQAYRVGMIINCEASFRNFAGLDLSNQRSLDHLFAAFTIGEAATATIVTDENPDDDFYFRFKSFGEYYNLCMIPLENKQDFTKDHLDERYRPMKFMSQSSELIRVGIQKVLEVFRSDPQLQSSHYDICFGHAASEKANRLICRSLGLPLHTYFDTHSRFGNTVSASIPLGISLAIEENRLHRGNKTLIAVGSAGLSVGFSSFTF
jgi:3-oxoacyl-[acyl-carrier-protein] synthase III